jgi:hypothetical protein
MRLYWASICGYGILENVSSESWSYQSSEILVVFSKGTRIDNDGLVLGAIFFRFLFSFGQICRN